MCVWGGAFSPITSDKFVIVLQSIALGTREKNELRYGKVDWNGHSTRISKSGTQDPSTLPEFSDINKPDVTTIWRRTVNGKDFPLC